MKYTNWDRALFALINGDEEQRERLGQIPVSLIVSKDMEDAMDWEAAKRDLAQPPISN